MRKFLALGLAVALSGCAATGTAFKDHLAHTEPVPEEMSRIVVYRLDKAQFTVAAAELKLDKGKLGLLRTGGFVTRDVAPGAHTLNVDQNGTPGTCNLPFSLAGGETGYFMVAPRGANFAAQVPGLLLPWGSLVSALASEATMVAGAAVESAGKQCGGPFAVARTLAAVAQAMVMDLRESTK